MKTLCGDLGVVSAGRIKADARNVTCMPQVHLDDETIERLDSMRVDDESYDEIITELISIYEAEEMSLFHSGDVE